MEGRFLLLYCSFSRFVQLSCSLYTTSLPPSIASRPLFPHRSFLELQPSSSSSFSYHVFLRSSSSFVLLPWTCTLVAHTTVYTRYHRLESGKFLMGYYGAPCIPTGIHTGATRGHNPLLQLSYLRNWF